jgi:hypothetical protein
MTSARARVVLPESTESAFIDCRARSGLGNDFFDWAFPGLSYYGLSARGIGRCLSAEFGPSGQAPLRSAEWERGRDAGSETGAPTELRRA